MTYLQNTPVDKFPLEISRIKRENLRSLARCTDSVGQLFLHPGKWPAKFDFYSGSEKWFIYIILRWDAQTTAGKNNPKLLKHLWVSRKPYFNSF